MSTAISQRTVAQLIADRLVAQGVTRVYGLVGGHIQPMWDAVDGLALKSSTSGTRQVQCTWHRLRVN